MDISNELLENLAQLSRLSLTEDEKSEIGSHLQKIIAHIEKIKTLDLKDIIPTLSIESKIKELREDTFVESFPEELLKNAPKIQNNHFIIPKSIK